MAGRRRYKRCCPGVCSHSLMLGWIWTPIEEGAEFLTEAVQIHYVQERQHWVTSSFKDGEVKLFDSCFNGQMSPSLQIQIAQLYRPAVNNSTLLVTAEPVQQQQGGVDCGLFSIAFAYHAADGGDVSKLKLNQDELRPHLALCFEQQELKPFPPCQSAVEVSKKRHFAIQVYCVCGLPEAYDTQMISCDGCNQWFHFKYVNLTTPPDTWMCSDCSVCA